MVFTQAGMLYKLSPAAEIDIWIDIKVDKDSPIELFDICVKAYLHVQFQDAISH